MTSEICILDNIADPIIEGKTPLECACASENISIVEKILKLYSLNQLPIDVKTLKSSCRNVHIVNIIIDYMIRNNHTFDVNSLIKECIIHKYRESLLYFIRNNQGMNMLKTSIYKKNIFAFHTLLNKFKYKKSYLKSIFKFLCQHNYYPYIHVLLKFIFISEKDIKSSYSHIVQAILKKAICYQTTK